MLVLSLAIISEVEHSNNKRDIEEQLENRIVGSNQHTSSVLEMSH